LGRSITPDEQRQYNDFIDERLQSARRVLASLAGKTLSKLQQQEYSQVQSFVAQAQQTRKSDLVGARSLAERAGLLASDLEESVK
jgi:epoxyqueuosine reductase QueG